MLEFSHCSATSLIALLKMGKRFHIFLSLLKSKYSHSLMTDTNIKHPPTSRIAHQKPLKATWLKNDFFSNLSSQRGDNFNSALCAWHLSSNTRELTGKFAPPPSTQALMVVLEERESIADIIWRENEPEVIRWDQELTLQTATLCTTKNFFPASWIF